MGGSASYLASYKGWHYFKVPVSGAMTSTNIKATCEAAGYVTPCNGNSGCSHASSACVLTGLDNCGNPMYEISQELCGTSPSGCAQLDGVYQFMNNWGRPGQDGACGAESGIWCVGGATRENRYAFCASSSNQPGVLSWFGRTIIEPVDHPCRPVQIAEDRARSTQYAELLKVNGKRHKTTGSPAGLDRRVAEETDAVEQWPPVGFTDIAKWLLCEAPCVSEPRSSSSKSDQLPNYHKGGSAAPSSFSTATPAV
ncbi:Oncoprotein-induced transcript 3 protein [Branchiostoma belcheri]|nr:Oncoprotein-induced transcript 3 protein [Branchiostoma belcheri]